jgi:amino acid adenylation domain-containing protein
MSRPGDVLGVFLSHAHETPSAPAAKDGANDLDYRGLRDRVAALAAGLAAHGVQAGDRVALHMPNCVDFLVAALASQWIGAMFVPLAADDPPVRVNGIVEDCAPSVVLTNAMVDAPYQSAALVADLTGSPGDAPEPLVSGDRAAYAIYTSGTTGTPKGVVIGRAAFATGVGCIGAAVGLNRRSRGLCVSPFHFDGSFGTLFTLIAAGGSLVIPPRDALLFPRYFFRTISRERISYVGFSPSYLRLVLSAPELKQLPDSDLRVVALGGEACSGPDVAALLRAAPDVQVFNRYGPTETTIGITDFEITAEVLANGGPVPIGIPHPDSDFVLVDDAGAVVTESDQVGELYIGGPQLMDGYWGAPELTAQVMRRDIVAGRTLYRTADLVRRDVSGNYVYTGRADRVIKRNALRISLIELGDVLQRLPGVTAATCATFDKGGTTGIVAFVVLTGQQSVSEVRSAAAERLPAGMLPDLINAVDDLPLALSSKVDERRLLADAGLQPAPAEPGADLANA